MPSLKPRQLRWIVGLVILAAFAVRRCNIDDLAPRSSSDLPETCRVSRLSDGDSLHCEGGERLRLIGIDAPEMDQPPFGAQSKSALDRLIGGQQLRLEYDIEGRDEFDRLLAYAWVESRLINEEMVLGGWALAYSIRPNTRHTSRLDRAESSARGARAGMTST